MTKPIIATAPSLLDTSTASAQAAPGLLSSLGDNTSKPASKNQKPPIFWFIAIPLLLISLVVSAAVVIANHVTASFTPVNSSAAPIAVAVPAVKPPAVAKTPVSMDAAPVQVATIINDLPASPQQKAPTTASANNPHDRLSAALASAPAEPAKPAHAVTKVTQADGQTESATRAGRIKPAAKTPRPAAASTQSEVDDRDVTLLTALVASTKELPAKQTHHAKKSDNKAVAESKNSSAKDDGRNQDVVERRFGDSTASLLRRCKKLGVIEGELCRWRICSDRWDSDPACKANAQPKAPVADNSAQ